MLVASDPTRSAALADALTAVLPAGRVLAGEAIPDDYAHDEALTVTPVRPAILVRPESTAEVAEVLRLADDHGVPVTARGSGTGLSGAAVPDPNGVLISFERMATVLEIDTENHTATVQPGVTLEQLDAALAPHRLVYPVFPGEYSASLGGNVATNAGGMRAVKYGVTRHQVLGLEAVLAGGEVIRTGGKFVKATSGYDLTQLITGSEGTLAVVTEATLRLYPRLEYTATILVPFTTLDEVTAAVPRILDRGVGPLILEYIDLLTMSVVTEFVGLDLGIPETVRSAALAYLVVQIEQRSAERLDEDVAELGELLADLGALDVYVLPSTAGEKLIEAREKAFWAAKANGADDIVDIVVPRASVPEFMARVAEIADEHATWIAGCGHAGDGNVHLSVFQGDPETRYAVLRRLFEAGMGLGGAISGEHGIGTAKRRWYLELEDPAKLALQRRIRAAFDPNGVLNPGTLLD
ncbi:MAG: FAD-binding oxidoreductase [Actinomycetes bacterium]